MVGGTVALYCVGAEEDVELVLSWELSALYGLAPAADMEDP